MTGNGVRVTSTTGGGGLNKGVVKPETTVAPTLLGAFFKFNKVKNVWQLENFLARFRKILKMSFFVFVWNFCLVKTNNKKTKVEFPHHGLRKVMEKYFHQSWKPCNQRH